MCYFGVARVIEAGSILGALSCSVLCVLRSTCRRWSIQGLEIYFQNIKSLEHLNNIAHNQWKGGARHTTRDGYSDWRYVDCMFSDCT